MKCDAATQVDTMRCKRVRLPERVPNGAGNILEALEEGPALSRPLDVLVSSAKGRRRGESIASHVWSAQLPANSLCRLSQDVLVASPELCFALIADTLGVHELVKFANELCGTYSINSDDERGFTPRVPLTCRKRLLAFTERLHGKAGVRNAQRALAWTGDRSASPMETALLMLLCLPPRLGGYGFKLPELNGRVDIDGRSARLCGRPYLKCDLLWRSLKLAIEYDSDAFHVGADRIASDAARRNALEANGITVITATRAQVTNAARFDALARQVAALLGKRLHVDPAKHPAAIQELRRVLFAQPDFRHRDHRL